VLVQIFPESVLRIFSQDPALIAAGVSYLRFFSFDFLFVPFVFCIDGFLAGGGHTLFSLMNSIASAVLLRVPVCYVLAITLNMGLKGVGLGVPIASLGCLVAAVVFLMTGRWKVNVVDRHGVVEE